MENIAKVGIVSGVILEKDGKYLLVQEKWEKVYGLWNIPAGHVDQGETIEDAAIREAKEEVGFDVKLISKLLIFQNTAEESVKHIFLASITSGELHFPEDELLDAKWFTLDEIDLLNKENKFRNAALWDSISELIKKPGNDS